jgi:glutamate racemase
MKKLLELIEQLKIAEKEQKEIRQIVCRKSKSKDVQQWIRICKHYRLYEHSEKIKSLKHRINQLRLKYWYWK